MKLSSVLSTLVLCAVLATSAHAQNPPQAGQPQTGQPQTGQPQTDRPAQTPRTGAELPAAPAANQDEYQKQVSYALGQQFGMNLKQNEIRCNLESLCAGIADVVNGAPPKYTNEQLQGTMQRFLAEMQQKGVAKMEQQAAKNKEQEVAFLARNKTAEGVQTTPSGLQYKVIQQGAGPSPTPADTVRCNYRGTLLDGTEFDSSEAHGGPVEFPVRGRIIPGWTEALQKMKVGDKWQLFVPAALAYDMEPPGPPIEPGSMLIFDIELLGIVGQ